MVEPIEAPGDDAGEPRAGAGDASGTGTAGARVRASLLRAAPFALLALTAAVVLASSGALVRPGLVAALVPTLAVPALVELALRTEIPAPLQVHYLAFIVAGPFSGSALNLYDYLDGWDRIVHFDSGVMLAWAGMLVARRAEEALGQPLPRWFAASIVLAVPIAVAGLWEVCEFVSDLVIGTTAQNGNLDTMGDLVAGTLGALFGLGLALLTRRPRSLLPAALA